MYARFFGGVVCVGSVVFWEDELDIQPTKLADVLNPIESNAHTHTQKQTEEHTHMHSWSSGAAAASSASERRRQQQLSRRRLPFPTQLLALVVLLLLLLGLLGAPSIVAAAAVTATRPTAVAFMSPARLLIRGGAFSSQTQHSTKAHT